MAENHADGSVQELLPVFSNEDFCMNDNAFTWLFSFKDQPDQFTKKDIWLQNYAAIKLKINEQKYKTLKNLFLQKTNQGDDDQPNVTVFPDQPMELSCGKYTADKTGVSYVSEKGTFVEVISHPIMPVKKYVNIDNGSVQVELAFSRGRNGWRNIEPVTKETISAANKITVLANQDIAVTSENAKEVIKFLSFLESENIDRIPVQHSTSRLGWVGNRFIPYDSDLVFDTSTGNFSEMFSAVHEQGDYEKWKSVAMTRRTRDSVNLPFRMATAASFASPLVEKFGLLCFCMELEGESQAGKTVCLEFAASIWGDPRIGKWTQTLDTTKTALENLAGFANSLPLCLDEQQIVEGEQNKTNLSQYIYMFCNKTGRNRGSKAGGLQKKNNWNNILIMTGEQEATSSRSKAGALLRVIDVPFNPGEKMFRSRSESAPFMKTIERHFGFAGKEFIQQFQKEDLSALQDRLDELSLELEKTAASKQANSGALLILADELAERYIFKDGIVLTVEEVAKFLKTEEEVNTNARIYQNLCDWLISNKAKFLTGDNDTVMPSPLLGKVEEDTFFVIPSRLDEFFQSVNYSEKLFLRWAYQNGAVIDHASDKDRHHTVQVRVGKSRIYMWEVRLGVLDHDGSGQETSVPAGYTQVDDMDLPF